MKILSPFSKKEEVLPLIESGADELYCGIIPKEWKDRYCIFDTLNRRESYRANFSSFAELYAAVKSAHKRGVPVFVTMNGLYTQEQYPLVKKIAEKLSEIKVDGLIIADIGLLLMLQRLKLFGEIHMGTGGTTFNSRTVSFYKRLGVSRLILDRHLTVDEIRDISKKSSSAIELEVFILNTLCSNVDGFCTYYHGLSFIDSEVVSEDKIKSSKFKFLKTYDLNYGGHGCTLKFSPCVFDKLGNKISIKEVKGRKNLKGKGLKDCGACAIYDFDKIKIKSLKIVERGASTENKVRDTGFIKKALHILDKEKNISRRGFIKMTQKLYCDVYKYDECSGWVCYYPSVFASKN